ESREDPPEQRRDDRRQQEHDDHDPHPQRAGQVPEQPGVHQLSSVPASCASASGMPSDRFVQYENSAWTMIRSRAEYIGWQAVRVSIRSVGSTPGRPGVGAITSTPSGWTIRDSVVSYT